MKRFILALALFALSFTGLPAQDHPFDYYYPTGMRLIENEYFNGYLARVRTLEYGFVNGVKVLDRRVIAQRGFSGYSFREIDFAYLQEGSVRINRRRLTNNNEVNFEGEIVYKLPKAGETATWTNSGQNDWGIPYFNYGESTRVTISYNGIKYQALRVIECEEYDDGAHTWTTFWVKNWGDALRIEKDGTITWMNAGLFDFDVKNCSAFKDALTRMKAIDAATRDPKQYSEGSVTFKPTTIPDDLRSFAVELKNAILNRSDLTPFLANPLLEAYQKESKAGKDATSAFAFYMKDSYFSGLDVLASYLDRLDEICSIEKFVTNGNESGYVFPCYLSCAKQFKTQEKVEGGVFVDRSASGLQLGVVNKRLNIYKSEDTASKIKYIAEPYKLVILNSGEWQNGIRWFKAYSTSESALGYVLANDLLHSNSYQFAIIKTGAGYKLSRVLGCDSNDYRFELEQSKRADEIEAFKKSTSSSTYSIINEYPEAHSFIKNAIDAEICNSAEAFSVASDGIEAGVYNINVNIKTMSKEDITVTNAESTQDRMTVVSQILNSSSVEKPKSLPIDQNMVKAIVSSCYDSGLIGAKYKTLDKYNVTCQIAGAYYYKATVEMSNVSLVMVLKKNQWTPDKGYEDVYLAHKDVCDYLINEAIKANPKIKKVPIDLMKLITPSGTKYCKIEKVISEKKQNTRYILGPQVVF